MQYRSWLCIPGDSEAKLADAAVCGADVVVVDLADTIGQDRKLAAQRMTVEWLTVHRRQITESRRVGRWVRIGGLDRSYWRDDLAAAMQGAPDGIVLPRASGPDAVRQLAAELYELEQVCRIPSGTTQILPIVGETAQSAMTLPSWLDAAFPRLHGLAWNAMSVAAATGASRARDARGTWSDTCRFVRAQLLLAAHARGLAVIESAPAEGDDEKSVKAAADRAKADGFTGMLALQPGHLAAINEAFSPHDAKAPAGDSALRRTNGRRALGTESAQSSSDGPARVPILRPA